MSMVTITCLWLAVYHGTVVSSINVDIELKSVDYKLYDPDAFNVFNITEIAYKPSPTKEPRNALRVVFEFRKEVPAFDISFSLGWADQTNRDGGIIPSLMTVNGCTWISGNQKKTNRILGFMMHGLLVGGSTLPEKCPISAGKLYTVKNFYLRGDIYPSYMPAIYIYANFSWHMNKKITFSVHTEFDIKKEDF